MGKASRKGWIDSQCRCGGIAEGQTLGELEAVRTTRDYLCLRLQLRHSRLVALTRHLACTVKTFSKTNKEIYIYRGSILRFILGSPVLTLVSLCLEVNISRAYIYKRGQVTSI
ncbi:hypothetical protein ACN38_g3280 [Penicillium nordicum]|uniref:Uncharacterized protein n=1 Tax=Penicillium nordicum TaxID=229535 RepID=A0A0M9WI85_9EURO|nr:hypothetical protein ACN38_g3280 [Penicillium nordicum]